ncbi:copper resistance protein NlpE N-terminal domain-containing protein [Parapedobacter lycopersici]|uniref:copper resistance protein NlpE N-terminal domain-containing protein n=1 Tax=Parapedobacter lycopersici TaxID=1864939 RepID=UPI00333E2654
MKTRTGKWALGVLILAVVTTTACKSKREAGQANPDPAHNSQNALDWAGMYQGTLPCADCPGIQTTLTLSEDGGYTLQTSYLERGDSVFTETGQFTWDDAGGKITLDGDGQKLQVGENRLIQLDREGNRITGTLADHYILEKIDDTLIGKYWKLVELHGKPVEPGSTMKEPFIRLTAVSNRVEGTGGCNGMGGAFELKAPNRIRFSHMVRTMMACENMEIENDMIGALETADSYHASTDTLQLFRARMAPLAKFVAVPDK